MTVVAAPKRRVNLAKITDKGIAHTFSRVFGRNPPVASVAVPIPFVEKITRSE